jgi:hypothetical protein
MYNIGDIVVYIGITKGDFVYGKSYEIVHHYFSFHDQSIRYFLNNNAHSATNPIYLISKKEWRDRIINGLE